MELCIFLNLEETGLAKLFIFAGRKVLSLEEYASYFKNIDPVSQYKCWTTLQTLDSSSHSNESLRRHDVSSNRIKAAFVVSDPVDWGRDIQVNL